jgi:AcrR family transcriptional regulator
MSSPRPRKPKAAENDKPVRADARRNRERVLKVARELFERKGLSVEISEIARRASVGVGTVYRHFPTKEALIQEAAASYVQRLVDGAEAWAEASDPGKAFFSYLAFVAEQVSAKQSLGHSMGYAGFTPEDTSQHQEAFRSAMAPILLRAQRAGAVRKDVTVSDLIHLIRGTLAPPEGMEPSVRERLFEIVCEGLRRRS